MTLNVSAAVSTGMLSFLHENFVPATITIYAGVQPANADQPTSSAVQLIQFTVPGGFTAPAGGVAAIDTATTPVTAAASASGTATFARLSGTSGCVIDMAVGASGDPDTGDADLLLDTTTIHAGDSVTLTYAAVSL